MAAGPGAPFHRSPVTAHAVVGIRPDSRRHPRARLAGRGHGRLYREVPRGSGAGGASGPRPRASATARPALPIHPHGVHPRLDRVGSCPDRGRSPHPGPGRLSLARRLHRATRAGQLPGAWRELGRVLSGRSALRGGGRGQRRRGPRALLHQLPRAHRGRAMARTAPDLPGHPTTRPHRAPVAHRHRARRRRLRAV